MQLNTIEIVAENEEPGLKCLSMTVQRDDKIEYLHFGETPGNKPQSDSVLLAKERFMLGFTLSASVSTMHGQLCVLIIIMCVFIITMCV